MVTEAPEGLGLCWVLPWGPAKEEKEFSRASPIGAEMSGNMRFQSPCSLPPLLPSTLGRVEFEAMAP